MKNGPCVFGWKIENESSFSAHLQTTSDLFVDIRHVAKKAFPLSP